MSICDICILPSLVWPQPLHRGGTRASRCSCNSRFPNWPSKITCTTVVFITTDAPWCGHCQAFAPEFEKAAALLKERNSPVVLAKVDVSAAKELATGQKISFLPTLKFFRRGDEKPLKYNGMFGFFHLICWQVQPQGKRLFCQYANHKDVYEIVV